MSVRIKTEDGDIILSGKGKDGKDGTSGIPVPQVAEVGQILAVKTVDDDGKPTEWECIDNEAHSISEAYPIGSVYISVLDENPSVSLGYGTWERIAKDMTLWGATKDGEANTTKSAGLPNITGGIDSQSYPGASISGNGAFSSSYTNRGIGTGDAYPTYMSGYYKNDFDASKSNSIYGNSTTVQPPALVVNIWKRVS